MLLMTEHAGVPSIQMDQTADKNSVHAAIRLLIPTNKWHEALMILNSAIELIRLEEGALMLEEIWLSQSDLERHLRIDIFHTVLLVVEMATESPEIRFDAIAHTTGMENIQRIREKPYLR
jgi:hypothetical protein